MTLTVTLRDFQAFAQERMAQGLANPDQFRDRFKEILDFAVANEAPMDAEANAYFENLLETIATTFEQGLRNVADSPDKRRMLRAIAGTRKKHHKAETFLKRLGMRYWANSVLLIPWLEFRATVPRRPSLLAT